MSSTRLQLDDTRTKINTKITPLRHVIQLMAMLRILARGIVEIIVIIVINFVKTLFIAKVLILVSEVSITALAAFRIQQYAEL